MCTDSSAVNDSNMFAELRSNSEKKVQQAFDKLFRLFIANVTNNKYIISSATANSGSNSSTPFLSPLYLFFPCVIHFFFVSFLILA